MNPARFELRLGDSGYPGQLAESPEPPEVLYGIGDPAALRSGLAVIGARKATPYGLEASARFAGWAAQAGYTVISGGAIGCDQAAHRAALAAGGSTVAVLACGPDVVYPATASALLEQVARNGAVVSEHPWGTKARRWAFRTRNRIIAGLSGMLLVVEAALPSGTFSTADYANDASRPVGVVPGSIFSPESRGSNRLLSQGGYAICDVDDLRFMLEQAVGAPPCTPVDSAMQSMRDAGDPLLAAVRATPMRADDLAFQLGLDIVQTARGLSALEVAGLVVRHRDGRYMAIG